MRVTDARTSTAPTSDKFLLGTIATLFGAFLRMPYALARLWRGRNWRFSAIVLLIRPLARLVLLTHPGLPLWPYLGDARPDRLRRRQLRVVNEQHNAFYPHRLKVPALGIAGGSEEQSQGAETSS